MKSIKYLLFLFLVFSFFFDFTFALSTLPKNAFLRYGDNQKEVLILQEILNSDPETIVAQSGVGSKGRENWFFGLGTENALKKFQKKYGLSVTGQIDTKTLVKLNEIATNKSRIITATTNRNVSENNYSEDNYNPYLDNSTPTVTKTSSTTKKTILENTFLSDILSKYSSLFAPNTKQTTPIVSNNYSSATPYYNPQTGTYSNVPASSQNNSGGSGLSPYGNSSYSNNPYFGNNSGIDKYTSGLPFGGQPGSINNIGRIDGILPSGSGSCGDSRSGSPRLLCIGAATKYAHGGMSDGCVPDAGDQQNNQVAASGIVMSRAGVRAIPAVALPLVVTKRVGYGTAVEVKNTVNGICKAFPILDAGPSNAVLDKGTVIDLTGSAFDILSGKTPCANVAMTAPRSFPGTLYKVQYAVNMSGKKLKPGEIGDCTMLSDSN